LAIAALATPEPRLRFLLGYAILAPSSHNTQPWRFRLRGPTLDLLADRRRALPVVDPEDRALVISCGAALGHLRVAAEEMEQGSVARLVLYEYT
jgi:nitroreductase